MSERQLSRASSLCQTELVGTRSLRRPAEARSLLDRTFRWLLSSRRCNAATAQTCESLTATRKCIHQDRAQQTAARDGVPRLCRGRSSRMIVAADQLVGLGPLAPAAAPNPNPRAPKHHVRVCVAKFRGGAGAARVCCQSMLLYNYGVRRLPRSQYRSSQTNRLELGLALVRLLGGAAGNRRVSQGTRLRLGRSALRARERTEGRKRTG